MIIPRIYFLKEDEQLLVEGFTRRWTVEGPGRASVPLFYRVTRRKGATLGPTDYLRIRDTLTGKLRNELGPKLYFPGSNEEVVKRLSTLPLKRGQYVRLIDKRTGVVRVKQGEASVYLSPTEEILGKIKAGINVDEETAVLVRDIESGQLELITEPQVFFPASNQEIVEVRNRIRLEDHETVVIKDKSGQYIFKNGRDTERAFFLDPYSELLQLRWSVGIHKNKRSLQITHIDSRPKFMWYEFGARTQDNVELAIGITLFWQIVDVEAMVTTTDDAPGDVCSHARSAILQSVSKVTLEEFLAGFNYIVHGAILGAKDGFYAERGVKIHAVEVRSVSCQDPATQHILQEIIEETTNRLNRLQKQESENEVKLKQVKGEIEVEEMRGRLLEIKQKHMQAEALMEGQAEAKRVSAFLDGLGDEISLLEKNALFNTLRKQDMLAKLSEGTAQLYFTPAEVDLSIENRV